MREGATVAQGAHTPPFPGSTPGPATTSPTTEEAVMAKLQMLRGVPWYDADRSLERRLLH